MPYLADLPAGRTLRAPRDTAPAYDCPMTRTSFGAAQQQRMMPPPHAGAMKTHVGRDEDEARAARLADAAPRRMLRCVIFRLSAWLLFRRR